VSQPDARQRRTIASATLDTYRSARRAAAVSLALLIVANFLGYALMGSNGLWSLGNYRHLKATRMVELDRLAAERTRLTNHIKLLDPSGVDADLADEMIRRDLGMVRPDEIIISYAGG
jgi:cell division protein FtsB